MLIFTVGWVKNPFSSQTKKIMLVTKTNFSRYLGPKHCRKPKFENFYTFFLPGLSPLKIQAIGHNLLTSETEQKQCL